MFNSKARYINNLFKIISKVFFIVWSLAWSIIFLLNIFEIIKIIPEKLYIDVNSPWMSLLTNTLFFSSIGCVTGFVYLIISLIIKTKCIKVYAQECKEIVNETVLPDKLPKVLYIYTAHNDLIEARVLQNMQQTYKNFEVWVSDGSDNIEWRNKIKKFCEDNKINLFQLGIEGSKNKSDNINQFLKQYKENYDYLLIGDADEVFHEKFVEYAIKMFYSNRVKNISYVVPLNVNYRSKGIYPNTTRLFDTSNFYWTLFHRSFTNSILPQLGGQSCLISRQCLIDCNKDEKFDDGNLEDWYLEAQIVENIKYGVMLPITPCYFEPDVNVNAHFNRIMRINDWIIRWWKIRTKEIVRKYSDRYSSWYKYYFNNLIAPIIIFFGLTIIALTIWILTNYWDVAFKNNLLFWISVGIVFGLSIITLLISSIMSSIVIGKFNYNFWDFLLFPIIFIMWSFTANIKVCKHWFNSLFLSKYSEFGGSGKSRFFKGKSKTIQWWLSLLILTIAIISFNTSIFLLTDWWNIKWLIIFFNVYVGVLWLGCFSFLTLWYINFIPYNSSFSREDWIKTKEIF